MESHLVCGQKSAKDSFGNVTREKDDAFAPPFFKKTKVKKDFVSRDIRTAVHSHCFMCGAPTSLWIQDQQPRDCRGDCEAQAGRVNYANPRN